MKKAILFWMVLLCSGCSGGDKEKPQNQIPADTAPVTQLRQVDPTAKQEYTILKNEDNFPLSWNVVVKVESEIPDGKLEFIAREIMGKYADQTEKASISFEYDGLPYASLRFAKGKLLDFDPIAKKRKQEEQKRDEERALIEKKKEEERVAEEKRLEKERQDRIEAEKHVKAEEQKKLEEEERNKKIEELKAIKEKVIDAGKWEKLLFESMLVHSDYGAEIIGGLRHQENAATKDLELVYCGILLKDRKSRYADFKYVAAIAFHNNTKKAIKNASLKVDVVDPNRTIPYGSVKVYTSFAGGLEPGEAKESPVLSVDDTTILLPESKEERKKIECRVSVLGYTFYDDETVGDINQ